MRDLHASPFRRVLSSSIVGVVQVTLAHAIIGPNVTVGDRINWPAVGFHKLRLPGGCGNYQNMSFAIRRAHDVEKFRECLLCLHLRISRLLMMSEDGHL